MVTAVIAPAHIRSIAIAGDALREPGEQRGGAADGEALVADLGGGGDRHLVHPLGRQGRVAPQQLADALDDEVVGAGLGVLALGLAERGAHAVDEDDLAQLVGTLATPRGYGGGRGCGSRYP